MFIFCTGPKNHEIHTILQKFKAFESYIVTTWWDYLKALCKRKDRSKGLMKKRRNLLLNRKDVSTNEWIIRQSDDNLSLSRSSDLKLSQVVKL